ncbi:hypothetical protein RFI_35816, partial [Reticulomyxa filosa]
MSDAKEDNTTEGVFFSFNQQSCFNKDWILQLNQPKVVDDFICLICKQVVNNPVEINCPQHEDMEETLLAGEDCLKQVLSNNNNICPVQSHTNCKYAKNKLAKRYINDLI